MEVKCSPELRDLIFRTRKPKKGNKEKPLPTEPTATSKPDIARADGKMPLPAKNDLKVVEPEKTGVPKTTGIVVLDGPEKAVLLGTPLGLPVPGDSSSQDKPEDSGGLGNLGNAVVPGKAVTPESGLGKADGEGKLDVPGDSGGLENTGGLGNGGGPGSAGEAENAGGLGSTGGAGNAGGPGNAVEPMKVSGAGNSGGGSNVVEPIVIDD